MQNKELNVVDMVFQFSEAIKTERSLTGIALQIGSETGELLDEVRRKEVPNFYKEPGVDGILGESCDVMIAVIDLLYKAGYTKEDILSTTLKKCQKWYNKMNKTEGDDK